MNWRYRETVLVLCTLAFFATMAGRLAISPIVPLIAEDLVVSNSAIGVALTGMWMSYSASQFPSGVLADRFGERPVILAAVGGTAIASILLALSPVYLIFLVATITLGAMAGLHHTVATTLLTRTYEHLGTAIGVHNSGAPIAGLLTPPIVAWIGVRYGWRPAIALGAAIAFPVFILFVWRIRPTEPRRPNKAIREQFKIEPIVELLTRPEIAFPTVLFVLGGFVWQATVSFLPAFLVAHRGQSIAYASLVFAAYFAVQATTQVGVGWFSDRFGRYTAVAGCMVLTSIGFLLLILVPGRVALAVAVLLAGTGLGYGAALFARFMDVLSEEERGAGFGLVRSVAGIFGALGPAVTGTVADMFGWGVAFGVLTTLLLVVLFAILANWTLR